METFERGMSDPVRIPNKQLLQHTSKDMMWPRYKVAYLPVNKAASTSMAIALYDALGDFEKGSAAGLNPEEWFVFSIVRDPWKRFLSCYGQKILRKRLVKHLKALGAYPNMPPGEFLDLVCSTPDRYADRHFKGQFYRLSDEGKKLIPHRIFKTEHLEDGWPFIREAIKRRGADIGPEKRRKDASSKRRRAADMFAEMGDEPQKRIKERYKRDYEAFGY